MTAISLLACPMYCRNCDSNGLNDISLHGGLYTAPLDPQILAAEFVWDMLSHKGTSVKPNALRCNYSPQFMAIDPASSISMSFQV